LGTDLTRSDAPDRSPIADADYRLIAEAIPHIVWMAAPDGSTSFLNGLGTAYTGHPAAANYDWDWLLLVHPDDVDRSRQAWEQAVLTNEPLLLDYRLRRHDGVYRWHTSRALPVCDESGVVARWVGTATDIDDAKKLEAAQQSMRQKADDDRRQFAAIVDGSGDAIFGATTEGIVTSWNAAAEGLFGYTAEEIIGQPLSTLAPPGGGVEQESVRSRLNSGGPAERFETKRRRKDGTLVDVLITASRATDEAGGVVGLSVIAHDVTGSRVAQAALEASERRLADAQRIAGLGSFEHDLVTGEWTRSAEQHRILGLDPRTAQPDVFHTLVHPDDRTAMVQSWHDAVVQAVPFDVAFRIIRLDGQERHVHVRALPEVSDDGTVIKLAGTMQDVTELFLAERVRRAADTRFEGVFEQAGVGALILGLDGVPTRVNPAACALLDRPAEQLVGRLWTDDNHPGDVAPGSAIRARLADGHDSYTDERRFLRPDGSVVWASTHVTLVRDESGEPEYLIAQLTDITERKQMEQELAHRALHDSLTGLPNRALLTDRLVHGLAGVQRRSRHLGVLFLDLDDFKVVNDSLGHACGDDLLRLAADRIVGGVRPGDTVARFGGDEFVVICEDVSEIEIAQIAHRVLEAVGQPCIIGAQEVTVTASLGVAFAVDDSTPESLLRDSDAAMYLAKERGRGRIEEFDPALRSKADRRLATASSLRRAVERAELVVHYQPIVDLSTGVMVSAEALVRWNHPDRGMISPAEFIPIAEETGLILPIGAWVLEQACSQLVQWRRSQPSMTVAVNLSVRQMLAPGITELIEDALRRTGAPAESLCLELTESVFMEDVDYFARTLSSLKSVGVSLAIDDFGTGYSSLSYLKRFPVDAVKVDRAFVDGLGTDPHHTALVAAIVAMADALGLEVTAEGVETRDQLTSLQKLQCERAQGFYLARPMPATELGALLSAGHRWEIGCPT
jgi:diguanylate cyclase (GGDEF)-like protein/PAS domain S-box-containing protein